MRILAAFALAATAACVAPSGDDADTDMSEEAQTVDAGPSDPNATVATRTVLANLHAFDFASVDPFDRRIVLGQQDADISNRASYGTPIVSDYERVTGRVPALVSYELSNVDRGATTMWDPAAFARGRGAMRERVVTQHRRGALVSFVWHMRCPKQAVTDRDLFAPNECPRDYRLEELLERKPNGREGVHFREWRAILDELAELLWTFKDEAGELIPVQLRPFHEFTGDWFWWGRSNGAASYAAAWREMVTYLRDGRGLHNVLWVFSPDSPGSQRGWESFYPGDAFVDVVAFDRYDRADGRFASGFAADLRSVGSFAKRHGKVAAVSEVGRDIGVHGADPTWFTRSLLDPLRRHGFAYASLWRNAPWEKFIPEPGDGAVADDFTRMVDDPATLSAGVHDLYRPLHVPPGS